MSETRRSQLIYIIVPCSVFLLVLFVFNVSAAPNQVSSLDRSSLVKSNVFVWPDAIDTGESGTHTMVVLPCAFSDIPGPPALEQWPDKKWTKQRIASYLDDPVVGFRGFLSSTLGLDLDYYLSDWRSLPHTNNYYLSNNLAGLEEDCKNAHSSINVEEFDTVVLWFNGTVGSAAGFGGNGQVIIGKFARPLVLVHEWGHAQGLLHYTVVSTNLESREEELAPPWSVMYGGGNPCYSLSWPHPEYDCLPNEFSTLDKYDLQVLPADRVCTASSGDNRFVLLPYGEPGPGCYLIKVPMNATEFLSLERRPTDSYFDGEYFGDATAGILLLARFDSGVGKYNSYTAMVTDDNSSSPGWAMDLLEVGESVSIRDMRVSAKSGNNVDILVPETDVDSGFQLTQDGYTFNNGDPEWGDFPSPPADGDYTLFDMQRMFGDESVCFIPGNPGEPCLVYSVKAMVWQASVNRKVSTIGHCVGMSTTVLSYFEDPGRLPPGYDETIDIPLTVARRAITYYSVEQYAQPVRGQIEEQQNSSTPVKSLEQVRNAISSGNNYVLLVMLYSPTTGHVVTPYALRYAGEGVWRIMVYDSNYPHDTNRYVEVNTVSNNWKYDAGGTIVTGNSTSRSLFTLPLSLFNGEQVPDWRSRNETYLESEASQIWLLGGGHLLITNSEGKQLGFSDGEFVDSIPNAQTTANLGGVDLTAEPVYKVPSDDVYTITLNGDSVESDSQSTLVQFWEDLVLAVKDIATSEVTNASFRFLPNEKEVQFQTSTAAEPTLLLGKDSNLTSYHFELRNVDLAEGESIKAHIEELGERVVLNSADAGGGSYGLFMSVADSSGLASFTHDEIPINAGATHYIRFSELDGTGEITIEIDNHSDGDIDEVVELGDNLGNTTMFLPTVINR